MMQQRLEAKLMVVRWGSEAVPGAGLVSNVSKAPWKKAEGRAPPGRGGGQGGSGQWAGPCKTGGHSVDLAGSGSEMFVLPFPLDPAEKSICMTRVTSGLASHGSHSFLPEHAQGHKHSCIFVPPVPRSGLSCCPSTGVHRGFLDGEFILSYSQPDN